MHSGRVSYYQYSIFRQGSEVVEYKTVAARFDTWFTSDCADLIEVRVFSKASYLYDAQHTQARRSHNCDSFRRCEKTVDMLNHTWTQPIWNNLRSNYLGQQTLSSVGATTSDDYFCSSPETHFWSFSGRAAAKEVAKTYMNVYYCDMWSRSVTTRKDNKYSSDI